MHDWGFHGGGMWLGWIIGIIAIIAVILLIVKATGQSGNRNMSTGKSALDILKERYARGEIDKEEFERRKKELM
jgi:putative membrane protein